MQQVPVSNIIMSMKSPKRSIVKRAVLFEIVKTECGPSRDVEGNVLVAECMNDITSHLTSCHLPKCSKVND